jgi:acetoin utilization deacetylase AcuC-like enzyme
MTVLFTHPACLEHDTGPGHPERPDRLRAVLAALEAAEFDTLRREEAPLAEESQLLLAHTVRHVDGVRQRVPDSGLAAIDPDTIVSPGSWEAARRAAGAVVAAVDLVMAKQAPNAFCAVRPPGHHAERTGAMGFCLFNNIAIGALHARQVHEVKRIAVVDFDVHHGNGTQDVFENDPDLFFASTHQAGAYPGTGMAAEHGIANNIVNVPLPAGSGSEPWRAAISGSLLPALKAFSPDLILISAGFDAHYDDPLASMRLTAEDFGWGTEAICKVAEESCGGRIVSTLEGGYHLDALASSAAAHVRALMASASVAVGRSFA